MSVIEEVSVVQKSLRLMAVVVGIILGACHDRLPPDFLSLPLEEKILATERFYGSGGWTSYEAAAGISLHGYEAAAAMLPYIRGKNEIPLLDVLDVLEKVQLRGCSLKGTKVERELELLAATTDAPEIAERANSILEDIGKDRKMPEDLDSLGPGTCEKNVPNANPV